MPSKTCLNCGDGFSVIPSRAGSAKFCSRQCYHEGHREGKTSHPERYTDYVELECANCGDIVEKLPSRANRSERHFCDQECYLDWSQAHQRDESSRRARYREREDASCEICGFDRYVEVCHIVPSADGGTYDSDNILFLCPNHHELLDAGELNEEERSKVNLSDE